MMKNARENEKLIKNQKGQAVLEYVLLNFIVVVICLSVLAGLSDSVKFFFKNYYGAYFECLLDTGELPAMGSDGLSVTECDDLFKPFTLAGGRGPNDPDSDNPDNPNDPNKNKTNDSDKNKDSNHSSDEVTASTGASEGGGDSSGRNNSFASGFGSHSQKVPLSNADKRGSKDGSDDLGNTSDKNNFQQSEEFGEEGSGRSPYVPIYGTIEKEKKEDKPVVVANASQDPEQALRGRRVPANISKTKENLEKPEEGMTFPDFIKYILIATILIVIVIFLGGQVMQYQKSQD